MCQRVSFVLRCNLSNQDFEESYFGNNFEDEDYDNFTQIPQIIRMISLRLTMMKL